MTQTRFLFFGIVLLVSLNLHAQDHAIDSIKQRLSGETNDTLRMVHVGALSRLYKETNPDSSYRYARLMLALAKRMEFRLEEVVALGEIGYSLANIGNYPGSLQALLEGIAIADDPATEGNMLPGWVPPYDEYVENTKTAHLRRLSVLSKVQQYTSILYNNTMNYQKALGYIKKAVPLGAASTNMPIQVINQVTLGRAYMQLQQSDSALLSFQKGIELAHQSNDHRYLGSLLLNTGRVYFSMQKPDLAKRYFKQARLESYQNNYLRGAVASDLEMAELYRRSGKADSSQYHIRQGLRLAKSLNAPDLDLRCYTALLGVYQNVNTDSTVKYQSLVIKINKDIFNAKQAQQFQNIDFDAQQRSAEIETARKEFQATIRTNILLGSLVTLSIIAFFLYRNNRNKQKANQKIEAAYEKLKATQSQLIQSEKMASLGELTAGIAHEIQNPLNFVNNFSEVNSELLSELKEAVAKGNAADVVSIAATLEENETKIVFHGKRADAIVKSMLQHSRASSGKKELTDMNALCDEYLRLAYHGLRAKDKSFNAKFETQLDQTVGNLNVLPQEMGRVILNLINNAFFAVTERRKLLEKDYEPSVVLTTKKNDSHVEIRVKDNGTGIPKQVLDKIFQPFFTTKPAGQGTGLGLSLSYDIVTKGHNGNLLVNSTEGVGTEFTILLPSE